MRLIEEVDLPEPVMDAHRSGDLVLFVGAGLSLDPPSSIPLFDGLAKELAGLAQVPYDSPARIDEFLGRLDKYIDVKAHTSARVSIPGSSPNPSHQALVKLATSGVVPRIITTNFDDHIAAAAETEGREIGPLYVGPALPNGRSFHGLVHLHGRAKADDRDLVITDRDFGRAYLTEAWATRFLQEVFVGSTVLFVGYSHNDLVMDYLAMGLPSNTKRYVLAKASDNSRWARLDVEPIAFPDGDYGAIARLFNAWASFASETPLAMRGRVHALVTDRMPADLTTTERDYIQWAVSTPIGAQSFAEAATDDKWLLWLRTEAVFTQLFQPNSISSPASNLLGDWFAQLFVADPKRQNIALDTVRRLGGGLSPQLVSKISFALRRLDEVEPRLVDPWRIYIESRLHLLTGADGWTRRLMPGISSKESARTLAALRRAVIPHASLESAPWATVFDDDESAPSKPTMTLTWPLTDREVRQLWTDALANLPAIAVDIIEIFEQALLDAGYLQASFDGHRRAGDYFRRASIASHEQNRGRGVEDVLIDGLRDAAFAVPGDLQKALIARWTSDDRPAIFRRLGLHLVTGTDLLGTREKTDLAISYLFTFDVKHEVFELVAHVAQTGNDDQIRRVIRAIHENEFVPEPDDPDVERARRIHERQKYDRLDWISRHTAAGGAVEAFAAAQSENPDMAPRPNPDHDSWLSGGVWGGMPPMELEEFLRLLENDHDQAMRQIVHEYPENDFSEPTWDDALQLIRAAVAARPDLGEAVLRWSKDWAGENVDAIDTQVFRGWEASSFEDSGLPWGVILGELDTRSSVADGAESRVDLLARFAQLPLVEREPGWTELAHRSARTILHDLQASFESPHDDWSAILLNTWPGSLATYWLREAITHHRAGVPVDVAIEGTKAGLQAPGKVGLIFSWFLASELLNYWLLDEALARTRVADVLLGHGPYSLRLQEVAWDGFFHPSRYAPPAFVNDEFFHRLAQMRAWIGTLDERWSGEAFLAWMAAGLVHPEIHESTHDAMIDSYVLDGDTDGLRALLTKLARNLEYGPEGKPFEWTPLLARAITRRVSGVPRRLGEAEAAAWSSLALHAGSRIEAVLASLSGVRAPLTTGELYNPLEESETRDKAGFARAIAVNLTGRLSATTNIEDGTYYELHELVSALRIHLSRAELEGIVNAAIGASRTEAVGWLQDSP